MTRLINKKMRDSFNCQFERGKLGRSNCKFKVNLETLGFCETEKQRLAVLKRIVK